MSRQSQFGARENTASSGQHASRLAVPSTKSGIDFKQNESNTERQALICNSHDQVQHPHAAPQRAATAGEAPANLNRLLTVGEVAELLQVPVSWVYGRTRKRTLDRLPGYKLGKYWRFNESEVLEWVKRSHEARHAA